MKNNSYSKHFLFCLFQLIIAFANGQSNITGIVKGLANGDSAIVRIQKSSDEFLFRKIGGNPSNTDIPFNFSNIPNGKWALSIDAKGYLFPVAKVLELNGNTIDNIITLTKAPIDSNFSFTWRDDSSFVGHAQQAYINDQVSISVLGKADKVPDEFNAINLFLQYGFLLSNEESVWTSEDAYRLYTIIKKFGFPVFGENANVVVNAKWTITDKLIDRDIEFQKVGNVDLIRISRAAFTYASPLVVTVDGVKGKFFSKRLFQSILYYYTDKGTNQRIDQLAISRYGFQFLPPGNILESEMSETTSNFQNFTSDEKIIVLSMIEEFPDAMHRQDQLKYMVRRINGQPIPSCIPCSAVASGNHVEYSEAAFAANNIEFTQRLVLHEKAHFLWAHTFSDSVKKEWTNLGGWFLDPTSSSGWSTSNTTEFVSAYAHAKNPNEDMAESIAWYITNPEGFRSRSIKKFEFVRDRIMKGSRYISVIRPDLTFQVYNLYPDYYYPGKIIRTKIDVIGGANEDKRVIIEIELHTEGNAQKGASFAALTLMSSIGTSIGFNLTPINADGSILRGERILPKTAKSGYWTAGQIALYDEQNNARWENTSTYGFKCYLNNPLEDIEPPLYIQGTLKMNLVTGKYIDISGMTASKVCGTCADTLSTMQAIKIDINVSENRTIAPNGRIYFNINYPTLDSTDKYNLAPYSRAWAAHNNLVLNDYPDSIKSIDLSFPIPDFYPSGYYSIPNLFMADNAGNHRNVFLDLDTANKNYFLPASIHQRGLRDSIYVKTKYPDYKPPIIDLNDIKIQAIPTNPAAPNGETLFEMWLWIKDESDFIGRESGVYFGDFNLRDPQGNNHNFSMQNGLGETNNDFLNPKPSSGFVRYYFKALLPKGSPPGLWGVSSINLSDRALNRKYYNFVEIVRFDVDQSNVLQVTPYVQILDKKVNAANAEALSVKIGCKFCKDQNYRIRMYSSMGGNSVVNEGVMTADTITLNNLKLTGVNDGILYATVFMLDSSKALIGTGRATYTKDTQIPKSQQLQTNLANFGKSNLDSLIVYIKSTEKNGTYNLSVVQSTLTGAMNSNIGPLTTLATANGVGDSVVITGTYVDGNFQIPVNVIKSMHDGLIELRFYLIDSVGNVGEMIKSTLYKDTKDPVISFKKLTETGLITVVSMTASETIFNTVSATNLIVKNATIGAVEKVDRRNYKIILTRTCADTLGVELKEAVVKDTVGNLNTVSFFQSVDAIVPPKPAVSAVSLCQGGSTNMLTAIGTNGSSLHWYATATGDTASVTAPTPSTTSVGTSLYYVSQKNTTTQCEGLRSALEVVVHPIPTKPTISRQPDGQLLSSSPSGNQWYKENVLIQGATSTQYKPTEAANYSVKSTINSCVSLISDSYYLVVTALTNFSIGEYIRVTPNPIQGNSAVQFKLNGVSKINLEILDLQGKIVIQKSNISSGTSIGLIGLKHGTYFMKVSSKEKGLIHVLHLLRQ